MDVEIKVGDHVKAKRSGWNEVIPPDQVLDVTPANESYDTDDMDLEGPLEVIKVPASLSIPLYDSENNPTPWPEITMYLVGGREADPNTIELVES